VKETVGRGRQTLEGNVGRQRMQLNLLTRQTVKETGRRGGHKMEMEAGSQMINAIFMKEYKVK